MLLTCLSVAYCDGTHVAYNVWLIVVPVVQIFGFDILLDQNLKAWLIEVNTGPDLSSSSPLDKQLKHKMVAQMMHLVGVVPYDRYNVTAYTSHISLSSPLSSHLRHSQHQ